MKVPWRLKATPILLKQPVAYACSVRSEDYQPASGTQKTRTLADRADGISHVLDDMEKVNGIKTLRRIILRFHTALVHRKSPPTCGSHSAGIKVHTFHIPSPSLHLHQP